MAQTTTHYDNTTTDYAHTYVWTIEDEITTGTLADYAETVEHGHYADVEIGPAQRLVITGDGAEATVALEAAKLTFDPSYVDDWQVVTVTDTTTGETAGYRVDLRA